MSVEGNVIWYGASERPYRYQVFGIDSRFEPVDAVYLLTRRIGRRWDCIAIGNGNLASLGEYSSSAQRWIDGVTHVHVRYAASPVSRLIQANDIRTALEIQRLQRKDRDPVRQVAQELVYVNRSM